MNEEKIVSLLVNPTLGESAPTQKARPAGAVANPRKKSEWTQAFQDLWVEISKGA